MEVPTVLRQGQWRFFFYSNWPEIDEDLSIAGLLRGDRAR
jgi:hypothetical protein